MRVRCQIRHVLLRYSSESHTRLSNVRHGWRGVLYEAFESTSAHRKLWSWSLLGLAHSGAGPTTTSLQGS